LAGVSGGIGARFQRWPSRWRFTFEEILFMCLICLDFQRQKLSLQEARRAYGEMVEGLGAHAQEVKAMLDEAEKKAQQQPKPPVQPAINAGGVVTKS
jgi:hypothetical protein